MKYAVIIVIACLLAGAGLLGWQLVDTYRANVTLSNRVIELDTEVASLEIQISELESNEVETYYEGVWSLCMVFNAYIATGGGDEFVDCETMVSSGYDMKWHERDAPGFEWPPAVD
jgi:hypothetical protein